MGKHHTLSMNTALLLLALPAALAFSPSSSFGSFAVQKAATCPAYMGYVPDGLSKEQYEKIKKKDKDAAALNKARVGVNRFRSRSMQAFKRPWSVARLVTSTLLT